VNLGREISIRFTFYPLLSLINFNQIFRINRQLGVRFLGLG